MNTATSLPTLKMIFLEQLERENPLANFAACSSLQHWVGIEIILKAMPRVNKYCVASV